MVGAFEAGQTSRASTWVVFLATTGLILSAAYMLYLYRRIIFDKITREDVRKMVDLHWRDPGVCADDRGGACGWGFIPTCS